MSVTHAPDQSRDTSEPPFGFWRRSYAMVVKEFIQLRRDRVSFAMIVMIPVMQLLLFGYALNTTPRHLPTAVLLQEDSDLARSILKALENTAYFRFTHEVHDVAEFDNLLQSGKVLFGVEIPRGLSARCGVVTIPRCWSRLTRQIRSPLARRCRRSASWCRPRCSTICLRATHRRCRSRSAPMRAITRPPRRGSISCRAWSAPS